MGGEKRKAGGFTCKCDMEDHENKIDCELYEKLEHTLHDSCQVLDPLPSSSAQF
jgi:hypothetical protein